MVGHRLTASSASTSNVLTSSHQGPLHLFDFFEKVLLTSLLGEFDIGVEIVTKLVEDPKTRGVSVFRDLVVVVGSLLVSRGVAGSASTGEVEVNVATLDETTTLEVSSATPRGVSGGAKASKNLCCVVGLATCLTVVGVGLILLQGLEKALQIF
ncbi:hypothetical protein YC2023_001567 [Brassica napus]